MKRRDLLKAAPVAGAVVGGVIGAVGTHIGIYVSEQERFERTLADYCEAMDELAVRDDSDAHLRTAVGYVKHCMEKVAQGDRYVIVLNGDDTAFALLFDEKGGQKRKIDFA